MGAIREYLESKRKDMPVVWAFLGLILLLAFASMWAWMRYINTPPYVDPERYPVRGIDVSVHNGMMNLDAAAADGVQFVWIKASEGARHRDENFHINYTKAGHAGMKRGAYHYFRFDRDGVDQARNFLKAIGNRKLELGIAIDVEDYGNATGVPTDTVISRLGDMVEYLNLKGHRVMFYTNKSGYEKYLMESFPGMPLWICHFSELPFDAEWTFWQYDHHGKVQGIRGDVDLNVYVGSQTDWEKLGMQ